MNSRRFRMIVPVCVLMSLPVLHSACSTSSQGRAPAPQIACATERPIGSHIPQRACRSRAEVDAERKSAQSTIDSIKRAPTVPAEQY